MKQNEIQTLRTGKKWKDDSILYYELKDMKKLISALIEETDGCLKEEAGIHGVVVLHKTF